MKFLYVCLTLFLVFKLSVAHADWREICQTRYEIAKKIMKNRQWGQEMPKLIEIARGDEYVESLIIRAYDEPVYFTEMNRMNEVNRFSNEAYLECVKLFNTN